MQGRNLAELNEELHQIHDHAYERFTSEKTSPVCRNVYRCC